MPRTMGFDGAFDVSMRSGRLRASCALPGEFTVSVFTIAGQRVMHARGKGSVELGPISSSLAQSAPIVVVKAGSFSMVRKLYGVTRQ
ncbi:MAG: hypothetical protein GF331_05570 [Chitinivibrionales bacterium]|nr:hypothetical protein [Chitinivibrionales bacterium]